MIIYFINKNSRIKGPFDIVDENRKSIMNIGDVCIREKDNHCDFLIIVSPLNSWNKCLCIGISSKSYKLTDGNTLLLSFDGIDRRCGNIDFLKICKIIFEQKNIYDFFSNAIEILEYKKDCWTADTIYNIYNITTIPQKEIIKEIKILEENNESNNISFIDYLPIEMLNRFNELSINKKNTLRNIFTILRKEFPIEFRKSIICFIHDNPNSSIYNINNH